MATKEQPQPTNVAQPEMPMQPNAYQAYPPQYAYEDPNKGKAIRFSNGLGNYFNHVAD